MRNTPTTSNGSTPLTKSSHPQHTSIRAHITPSDAGYFLLRCSIPPTTSADTGTSCTGVQAHLFLVCVCAPAARRTCTAAMLLCLAARCRGVFPCMSVHSIGAPAAMSVQRVSAHPFTAASCKTVYPCSSSAVGDAPASY